MDIENMKEICKYLEYEYFPAGSTIFDQGTFGTHFYIIIKGKVNISILDLDDIKRVRNLRMSKNLKGNLKEVVRKSLKNSKRSD